MTLFAFLLTINFQKRHLNKECDWSPWPIRNVNFFSGTAVLLFEGSAREGGVFRRFSGPENLKKSRKKLVKSNKSIFFLREIAFLAVLNFFPFQKLIFGHLLKLQKMEFVQKKKFVKLIYLIS